MSSAMTKLVKRVVTLGGGAEDEFKAVVVADTHGRPHAHSGELISAERPDAILHAGDIGDLAVLGPLAEIAPLFAIRGNIDVHARDLPDALTLDVQGAHQRLLRMLLLHIAVYGPKLRADAARLARSENASLVVCGHSHVPFIGRDRGLLVFNPGSIGPRRFDLPIVFGVIEVSPDGLKMRHVDCETGRTWQPPRAA
jgi:putative phosphoesterase